MTPIDLRDDPRDDKTLIADHVGGDPDAFSVLVSRHRDRLWAVALRTLSDRADITDAQRQLLMCDNALRFYGIKAPARV